MCKGLLSNIEASETRGRIKRIGALHDGMVLDIA
jgi:hypothetical protein